MSNFFSVDCFEPGRLLKTGKITGFCRDDAYLVSQKVNRGRQTTYMGHLIGPYIIARI